MIKGKIASVLAAACLTVLLLSPMMVLPSAAQEVTPASVLLGDVVENGAVDMFDALTVYNAVAGKLDLTEVQRLRADMNGDGKVGLHDAVYLFYYVMRLIPTTTTTTTTTTTLPTGDAVTTTQPINVPSATTSAVTTTTVNQTTTTAQKAPQTGETPQVLIPIALMVTALSAMIAVMIKRREEEQ